jgi:hypothetical protein
MNDVNCRKVRYVSSGMVPGFERETDFQAKDDVNGLQFTDGTNLFWGYIRFGTL